MRKAIDAQKKWLSAGIAALLIAFASSPILTQIAPYAGATLMLLSMLVH